MMFGLYVLVHEQHRSCLDLLQMYMYISIKSIKCIDARNPNCEIFSSNNQVCAAEIEKVCIKMKESRY